MGFFLTSKVPPDMARRGEKPTQHHQKLFHHVTSLFCLTLRMFFKLGFDQPPYDTDLPVDPKAEAPAADAPAVVPATTAPAPRRRRSRSGTPTAKATSNIVAAAPVMTLFLPTTTATLSGFPTTTSFGTTGLNLGTTSFGGFSGLGTTSFGTTDFSSFGTTDLSNFGTTTFGTTSYGLSGLGSSGFGTTSLDLSSLGLLNLGGATTTTSGFGSTSGNTVIVDQGAYDLISKSSLAGSTTLNLGATSSSFGGLGSTPTPLDANTLALLNLGLLTTSNTSFGGLTGFNFGSTTLPTGA